MSRAGLDGIERRLAARYRLPGRARVFWGAGEAEGVEISDMSAGGCQVVGHSLPGVGTRVFLSLELGGLPNVRLAATVMRRAETNSETRCGLRFDVPSARMSGLTRLLDTRELATPDSLRVLVVDSEAHSRERVTVAVERMGAEVTSVGTAIEALGKVREDTVNVVLARADTEGLAALAAIAQESKHTFRVAFGRGRPLTTAVTLGIAEATADDPCSAKCLGELMHRKR
jgi:CheY-like chemotaxis protein